MLHFPETRRFISDEQTLERLKQAQAEYKIVLLDMGLAIDTYLQAERQAIPALREYGELAFAAIPDGLVVLSADLTVISANRAFLGRFGLSEAGVHGRPLLALVAAEGLEARLAEVRATGVTQHDLPFSMGPAGGTSRMPVRITLLNLAQRLEAALAAGQLQLHYQPQMHLASGGLVGAEALARWHDAELGSVSPAEFIAIAEERGLIGTLGEWALAEVCRQARLWQECQCPLPGKIAVNVAARQFEDDGFIERCLGIARQTGTAPSAIELELTESGMMRGPERAVEVTHALAAAGFALSIDDFGTSHSSLAYLKWFPVHKLKIDISFVRDMLVDRNDYLIVSTIVAMGRSMELETLTEGVEQPQHATTLLALGCQFAQGYYFGRPLNARDFERTWLSGTPS